MLSVGYMLKEVENAVKIFNLADTKVAVKLAGQRLGELLSERLNVDEATRHEQSPGRCWQTIPHAITPRHPDIRRWYVLDSLVSARFTARSIGLALYG